MTYGPDIIDFAKQFVGTPYSWGGNSLKNGVDCSGLVQQVYKHFGVDLPRTTYDQIGVGKSISIKGLKPGDLVFFDTDRSTGGPDHVGIYMGEGKMIHAPRPGKGVEIVSMTSGYYLDRFMGGRRVDGVKNAGASSADFGTPKMSKEELASSYGYAYAFLNSNPTLKKLFDQAIKDDWTPEKFTAELMDTDWWKEHSATQRQAAALKAADPASYAAQIDAAKIHVQQMAAEIGAPLLDKQLNKIAKSVVDLGINDEQLADTLGKYIKFVDKNTLLGAAGMYQAKMKEYAAKMGVKVSDQSLKDQAAKIARRIGTEQDYQDLIRQQAKEAFPSYADAIDAGATVEDIASPYTDMMSKELELPDGSVTLDDPTIKSALNGLSRDGKPTGVTLTDFQARLRNDPRWKKTKRAQNSMMSVAGKVLSDMGLIPPNGGMGGDPREAVALPED